MNRYAKRLLIAFSISVACYQGVEYWHQSQRQWKPKMDKEPVALLKQTHNEVQRKPLTRLIWETVSKDEKLYAGEAIRTDKSSVATILFLKKGMLIELEPHSLIVLDENKDGLTLNFLEGNMTATSVDEAGTNSTDKITVTAGKSQISLNNANVSLSKSKDGAVGLDVFSGTAELKQGNKKLTLDKSRSGVIKNTGVKVAENQIEVIHPIPGSPVYINPQEKEAISFAWQTLPPGYKVTLEAGNTRESLKPLPKTVSGSLGQLKQKIPLGKIYWRLVATSSSPEAPTLTSKVIPITVRPLIPPVVLEPEDGTKVSLSKENKRIRVAWAKRSPFESLVLEVATDPDLQKKVIHQPLSNKLNFTEIELTEPGVYFWRITGFIEQDEKLQAISSRRQRFELALKGKMDPPELRSPMNDQQIDFTLIQDQGMTFTWDNLPGVKGYELILKNTSDTKNKVLTRKTLSSPFQLKHLEPGTYEWTVTSIGPNGLKSQPAPPNSFVITEMPTISWLDGNQTTEFLYWTARPSLMVSWSKETPGVKAWKVHWHREQSPDTQSQSKIVNQPTLKTYVDQDGFYNIEVEALDKDQNVIARSPKKQVHVREKPYLQAPDFAASLPKVLKSDQRGGLKLQWKEVEGASKYRLQVLSKEGQVLHDSVTERTIASVQRLQPGEYQVKIKSIDEHQREGPEVRQRKLIVPNTSNIRAPKLKQIEVK